MVEKHYPYTQSKEKVIEKLIGDDVAMINHVVLATGDALSEHYSDSNVYLVAVRGSLTIQLEDQEARYYQTCMVNVPFHTKMNISNTAKEALEFVIAKAPHPRACKAQTI